MSDNVFKSIPLKDLALKAGSAIVQSIKESVATGTPIAAEADIRRDRLKICLSCPHFGVEVRTPTRIIKYIGCGACGCVVKYKTMLAHEKCPIGKW